MSTENKNWWLYVLKLEEGKYYVGITSKTPERRFRQHMNGTMGARWTRHYKPIKIYDSKQLGSVSIDKAQEYEGKVTREYMKKYGDNNVRGGDLTEDEDYIRRFGRIFTKDNWDVLTVVILQTIIIAYLGIDKYILN